RSMVQGGIRAIDRETISVGVRGGHRVGDVGQVADGEMEIRHADLAAAGPAAAGIVAGLMYAKRERRDVRDRGVAVDVLEVEISRAGEHAWDRALEFDV